MKEINIFGHTYLYSAYADYKTFLLRDKISIKELINTFATFWKYSGWKPNHKKCEIAGYSSAEKCESGMKCIDLYYKNYWNLLFVKHGKAKWKKISREHNQNSECF